MNKRVRILLLAIGISLLPLCLSPVQAQAQENELQRAHDAGYQNGANDARRNRPINMRTDDWKGDRLTAYERGYKEGYYSIKEGGEHGVHGYQDPEMQRAYQAGYNNGLHDRQSNHPMNMKTGDWKGDRLDAYRKGYQEGYSGNRDHEHDYPR